jgi:hypothetical protein
MTGSKTLVLMHWLWKVDTVYNLSERASLVDASFGATTLSITASSITTLGIEGLICDT